MLRRNMGFDTFTFMKLKALFVIICLFFSASQVRAEDKVPVLYDSDWAWMKATMAKVQSALEDVNENPSTEALALKLEPIIVNRFLPFVIQKSIVLGEIEKKIKASNNSNQKADLNTHKQYHEEQIAYLCNQLKVRYGFAKIWNSNKTYRDNLTDLNARFSFKKNDQGNIVFRSGVATATKQVPGTRSASFSLMLRAFQERIDTRYSDHKPEERTEAFRSATISRCAQLPYYRIALDLESDFSLSDY